jgi:hypothetical protein
MFQLSSLAKRLRYKIFRSSLLILALTLGYAGVASATPWQIGDMITYPQGGWSDDPTGSNTLITHYGDVYGANFGVVEIGIPGIAGFSIRFSTSTNVLDYLPALGAIGPLNADLINPSSTSSGTYGGEVLALQLNIDFSDAGFTLGNAGIPFGDLILSNFSTLPGLNGLTVRDFSGLVNTLLGGGSNGYTISELYPLTVDLNSSFGGGGVSQFALDHLNAPEVTHPAPEPTSFALMLLGLAGLKLVRRRKQIGL